MSWNNLLVVPRLKIMFEVPRNLCVEDAENVAKEYDKTVNDTNFYGVLSECESKTMNKNHHDTLRPTGLLEAAYHQSFPFRPAKARRIDERRQGEKMNLNQLYCEDCIAFMQKLPANYIDVIVTSPPYNIGKKYTAYRDDKSREEYLAWMEQVAIESKRILKDNGSFFLNVGGKPSDLVIPYDVENRFRRHYTLQNDILWVKSIAITKGDVGKSNGLKSDFSIGHYKPINSNRYLNNCHENIFHFTKEGKTEIDKLAIGVPYGDKSNIERWGTKEDKRDRGDVWYIPYETVWDGKLHPATFPKKLPSMCIKLHGIRKDLVVYDPFMGIGTTALACLELGVNYIGTEIDPNYIGIAEKLLEEKLGQLKLRT
jgi:site-specific DNA-methyltransferase (adenine-specific)